jgi:hypothetical protein
VGATVASCILRARRSIPDFHFPLSLKGKPRRYARGKLSVLVVKPADQGMRHDATDPLNRARDRRIFVQ